MTRRRRNAPRPHGPLADASRPGAAWRRDPSPGPQLLPGPLLRAVAITLLAGIGAAPAWGPACAKTTTHHHHHHAAEPSPHPAAATAPPADASHLPVRMIATQHRGWGRLTFELGRNALPALRQLPDGVELRFAPGTVVAAPNGLKLRQIAAVETREADGVPVALVRLACACAVTTENAGTLLRLDIRENPRQAGRLPSSGAEAGDLAKLRNDLTNTLAVLNAPPPATASKAASPGGSAPGMPNDAAKPDQAAPGQICLPAVNMTGWRSSTDFVSQLVGLRAQVARSQAGPRDMAALAEFYLAYGLGAEALTVASDALGGEATPDDHTRLIRDADIAHLLKGEQLDPTSPLLTSPPGCERADAALWRALAAAAARDADGVAQAADGARMALRHVPEPLLQRLAFRIAEAVNDNQPALLAMAGAVRNTAIGIPEDEAARFLLQARIAQASKDQGDYATFLERAARYDLTVPGLIAKARLAALRVARNDPDASRSEAVLADLARTYRFEPFGQRAAEHYAERRMQEGDYASALAMADESAGPDGPAGQHTGASGGAVLAARILRILLVDKDKAGLPTPSDRLALYWRYQGYTTPGDKGDDIRVGAARLMLAQRLPDAALGVVRQVAEGTAATPDVVLLRAEAEARAGDPATALAMLQSVPDGGAAHRVAADALDRMGRFAEAAHRLDGADALADKQRRAGLLFRAAAWSDAAAAYADVLGAAGSDDAARNAAAERYALALALAGATPPASAPALPELPSRLLALLEPEPASPQPATAGIPEVRSALDRARRIEQLLDPAAPHQGS